MMKAGSATIKPADAVIIAIGQAPDTLFIDGAPGLEVDSRGYIVIDPLTMATNMSGVFAGGDIVNVATAVDAIAAGKRSAGAIDHYLQYGHVNQPPAARPPNVLSAANMEPPEFIASRKQSRSRKTNHHQRTATFDEVDLGFTASAAKAEAARCLNCPICGNCILERSQMCYETAARLF